MKESVVAVIPARYESSRLPGKPLLEIAGLPLILHVVNRARATSMIERVIVATDDERIRRVVESAGAEAMMTLATHPTGTDRLAEVAGRIEAGIIVNIQGDEPMIDPGTIEAAIAPLLADPGLQMATTSEPITTVDDVLSPHVVKVVTDRRGMALYFSRHPLPYPRAAVLAAGDLRTALELDPALVGRYWKHTGLYVYRRDFLLRYSQWPSTPLEESEALEQLRVLEHGFDIRVVPVAHRSFGVDTPADLEKVRRLMAEGRG
jgi:3-deoxy-manno-octulosonate cytidylyltransferase (CMP-KDO synthetase)